MAINRGPVVVAAGCEGGTNWAELAGARTPAAAIATARSTQVLTVRRVEIDIDISLSF
jgi:hypothetical protein